MRQNEFYSLTNILCSRKSRLRVCDNKRPRDNNESRFWENSKFSIPLLAVSVQMIADDVMRVWKCIKIHAAPSPMIFSSVALSWLDWFCNKMLTNNDTWTWIQQYCLILLTHEEWILKSKVTWFATDPVQNSTPFPQLSLNFIDQWCLFASFERQSLLIS